MEVQYNKQKVKPFLHRLRIDVLRKTMSPSPKLSAHFKPAVKKSKQTTLTSLFAHYSPLTSPRFSITKGINTTARWNEKHTKPAELPSIEISNSQHKFVRSNNSPAASTPVSPNTSRILKLRNKEKVNVDKAKVKALLERCKELISKKEDLANSPKPTQNALDRIANKYMMNVKQVESKIAMKFHIEMEREVNKAKTMNIGDISKEIEEEVKRKNCKSTKTGKKFTFFELLEQDLKSSRENTDDKAAVLVSPRAGRGKLKNSNAVAIKGEFQKRFNKGVARCFSEMNLLTNTINSSGQIASHKREAAELLYKAIKTGDTGTVTQLLDNEPSLLKYTYSLKETPLFLACKLGDEFMVQKLLEKGADYKAKDYCGRSCKQIAERNRHFRILELLYKWKLYKSAINTKS